MTQKIRFIARDEFGFKTQTKPYPSSQKLPDWYKKYPPYEFSSRNPDGKKLIVENGVSNASYRKCMPMLDAMTSGYIIDLFADVIVSKDVNQIKIDWRTENSVMAVYPVFYLHGESSKMVEPPLGYSNTVYKYLNTWIPKTPPGYSCLITEPFGFRDGAFKAIPAIVDTDKSTIDLSFPMWLKKDFEGIVEKGTPMIQITPFKREDWKSEYSFYKNFEFEEIQERNFNGTIFNHYIKNHWSKKRYN